MIIEKIILPNKDIESDMLLSGAASSSVSNRPDGAVPFGIFPKTGLEEVKLSSVTLLCGSSNTPKALLLRIIASKMGLMGLPTGTSQRSLSEYLSLCAVVRTNKNEDGAPRTILITKEQSSDFLAGAYADIGIRQSKGLLSFYEDKIESGSLCFIEEPETGMSLSEQNQFASLVYDLARLSGNQFVITTNSPVLMSIPRALIYDFDRDRVRPESWYTSGAAKLYAETYEDIRKKHHMKN